MTRATACRWLILVAAAAAGPAAGCASAPAPRPAPAPSAPPSKDDLRDFLFSGPARVSHPGSIDVASGPAPLAYMTEQPATVWVTDSGGRQWGPVGVPAQTIVRVAQQTGVAAGRIRLDDGPLPPGRTYTIHVGTPPEYRPGH